MDNLCTAWHLREFPEKIQIPKFLFSCALGPNFSASVFDSLLRSEVVIEEIDFDTNNTRVLGRCDATENGGDFLYVVYDDPESWVYIMSTDLDWAVLYSNFEPRTIVPGFDFQSARSDFERSYIQRTTVDKAYYDAGKLSSWAAAAGLKSES